MKTLQLPLGSFEREPVFILRARLPVVLAMVLAGCGCDGVKKDEPDLSTFKGLYTSYLKDCGQCHSPDNIAYKENVKNLDMTSEDAAYNALKSNASIARLAGLGCDSLKYVEPGSASTSILYAIMDASTAESFSGACKPLRHTKADGGEANSPTAEQKQKIKEWIDKGAPRN